MEISTNPSATQSTAAQLSQSTQVLTAQPLTQEAVKAINNATPAAVYTPSEEAISLGLTMEAVQTYIGRPQAQDFVAIAKQHQSTHFSLKSAFTDFQSALAYAYPELANKKFGFTIEADGSLKALNTSNQLSESDMQQLNALLNASSDLKTAAENYRYASIEIVKADSAWGGSYMGKFNLNKENFADTIDLAALFIAKGSVPTKESIAGHFSSQLWAKGEPATEATDAVILAERAAKKAAVSA